MKAKRRNQILIGGGLVFSIFFSVHGDGLCGPCDPLKNCNPILKSGDLFPPTSFSNFLAMDEKRYLGVDAKAVFSMGDIQAEVLVIKVLNTNCVYCIKSLPVFKEVFEAITRDPSLTKRIKMMAIGAGDTPTEVAVFKEQHAVPYPIIPDTEFIAHKAIGEPSVPFIVVTRRDSQGKWVVATVHVGLTFSADSFIGELKAILEIDPDTLKKN